MSTCVGIRQNTFFKLQKKLLCITLLAVSRHLLNSPAYKCRNETIICAHLSQQRVQLQLINNSCVPNKNKNNLVQQNTTIN
jgi:hypothetical protein